MISRRPGVGIKSHVNVGVIGGGGGVQYLISRRPGVGTK